MVTPYLNYDYVDAKLKAFAESGLEGARLTVANSSSKHMLPDGRRQVGDPDGWFGSRG